MAQLLNELAEYHFPGFCPDQLRDLPFTKTYCKLSSGLHFYKGYLHPSPLERAKIYRALNLACDGTVPVRHFIIITSEKGLTIRGRSKPELDLIRSRFDRFLQEPDDQVFLPPGYSNLSDEEYPYRYHLLELFRKTLPFSSRLITVQEYSSKMLLLALTSKGLITLRKWEQFLRGTPLWTISFPPFQIKSLLKMFPWGRRGRFSGTPHKFQLEVMEYFRSDLDRKLFSLKETSGDLGLSTFDLGSVLQDEYEMVGLLLILMKRWPHLVSEMIPLVGTPFLITPYTPEISQEEIRVAIQEAPDPELPTDEIEIFTQDPFIEMSKLKRANLIQAPSGNWYSFLDLCQTKLATDPITREEFSEEFRRSIRGLLESIRGPTLENFPPIKIEPECLSITSDEGNTSFYIQLGSSQTLLFWKIPPIDSDFMERATYAIKIKWTDGSLFGPFKETCIEYGLDLGLIFSPQIYRIFQEDLEDPGAVPSEERAWRQLKALEKIL